jgi:inorganic pyrophosphatase
MAKGTSTTAIDRLRAYARSGELNVIIETPKGNRNKFKYEPELGVFLLNKVLPAGAVFPFDFGFVPGTLGEDGDPLDVLVLMDDAVFAGCLVPARLIGVIEAEETKDGETERNDRLLAVALASENQSDVKSAKDLDSHLLKEIEHFFESYNVLSGKEFKCLDTAGPKRADKLVEEGIARNKAAAKR